MYCLPANSLPLRFLVQTYLPDLLESPQFRPYTQPLVFNGRQMSTSEPPPLTNNQIQRITDHVMAHTPPTDNQTEKLELVNKLEEMQRHQNSEFTSNVPAHGPARPPFIPEAEKVVRSDLLFTLPQELRSPTLPPRIPLSSYFAPWGEDSRSPIEPIPCTQLEVTLSSYKIFKHKKFQVETIPISLS
ncbi:hypothetical protein Pelo_998 [Pelomyxa schiedti]|nr:hypothetical protein Pelo_998 [Pelomyxa schiedti]